MSKITILLVGSNPSVRSLTDKAFDSSTYSGRILQSWLNGIDGTIYCENITSQKTENNRPLNSNEMALARVSLLERINRINPDRLVALGKSAAEILKDLGLEFLEMPHPSGLNRKLNDKEFVKLKLAEFKAYCI